MRIRRKQLDKLIDSDERRLLAAITSQVRVNYAPIIRGLPDDLLDEMIANGVRTARSFGLTTASDLAGFVNIMFEVGPEFHRHPAVRSVLTDETLTGDQKLSALFDRTAPEVWDQIESTLAQQTWFPESETDTE